jgi:hypothetical protein
MEVESDAEAARSKLPRELALKAAIRRARIENAEQSESLDILHGAEIVRLEILRDRLAPLLAEIPPDVDLFDVSLASSSHPRLFIDMIAFVEMGHDKRSYRFIQDTRRGRIKLAESERIDVIVQAVTDYIARRLVEREKVLAADTPIASWPASPQPEPPGAEIPKKRQQAQGFRHLLAFLIELLGSMMLFILVVAGCYLLLGWLIAIPPHAH